MKLQILVDLDFDGEIADAGEVAANVAAALWHAVTSSEQGLAGHNDAITEAITVRVVRT